MTRPKLKTIEIQGFRAFGAQRQDVQIDAPIAVFLGPNSKGKTSFAEAIEFLLTGKTVKREILSSRKDEFADSLRHAHLDSSVESFVAATLECDGTVHAIKRVLDKDYSKKGDCETTLYINGTEASEDELAAVGIVLFQPPLSAPVLAQHTLNYLFTVKPSDRMSYFKALLEVTDLDEVRQSVFDLEAGPPNADQTYLDRLRAASEIPEVNPHLPCEGFTDSSDLEAAFAKAVEALLLVDGLSVPQNLQECVVTLQTLLADKRSKTFPLQYFKRTHFVQTPKVGDEEWAKLDEFLTQKDRVEEETGKLIELFKAVLKLEAVGDPEESQDCPVCGTEGALTTDRINFIRESVEATASYQSAKSEALAVLRNLSTKVIDLGNRTVTILPEAMRLSPGKRRKDGFTINRLKELLGDEEQELVQAWVSRLRMLHRKSRQLHVEAASLTTKLEALIDAPETLTTDHSLDDSMNGLIEYSASVSEIESEYQSSAQGLVETLKAKIDSDSATEGWQEFIDLAQDLPALREVLVEKASIETVTAELKTALRQIDKGIGKVLDEKFTDLSDHIESWWELLRGGESTIFSSVSRRGKGTLDFKAGLVTPANASEPEIRDAIAVFSDSQLHCLGLAIFLARAEHYGAGFVVLDDPVLSSDEDYRIHFRESVIQLLHKLGIQVIILTQHRSTWRDIADVNSHLGVDQFQIDFSDPAEGSTITKSSDELLAMLSSASAYTKSDDLSIRKNGGSKLRDAVERFCKLILVKVRRENGEASAAISDYDEHRLGGDKDLVALVIPHLDLDNSHPGKLRTIRTDLNPANHDDDNVPSKAALKNALGNLRKFQKDYLR